MAAEIIYYNRETQDECESVIIQKFNESKSKHKRLWTFFDNVIFKMVEDADYFFACEISDEEIEAFRYVLKDEFTMHVPRN